MNFLSTSCEMRLQTDHNGEKSWGKIKKIGGDSKANLIHAGPVTPQVSSLPYAHPLSGLILPILGQTDQNLSPTQFFAICKILDDVLHLPTLSHLISLSLMFFHVDIVIKTHTTLTVTHSACFCIYLFIHLFLSNRDGSFIYQINKSN